MNVVVVGNEKGGVGKTTIAVNIAAMAARDGFDTLLVDADPLQQSSSRWCARRREVHPAAPRITCATLTGRSMRNDLATLAERFGLVIVDTGAEDSVELRVAALLASVMVVPVQPEPLDLWSLPTIEAIYDRARSLNEALRVVLAVNRIPHQHPDAAADVAGWVRDGAPRLADATVVPLINRAAYGRATSEGLGVIEVPRRDSRATSEMQQLYAEVVTCPR